MGHDQGPRQLRWTKTIARSGKFKDVSGVFTEHSGEFRAYPNQGLAIPDPNCLPDILSVASSKGPQKPWKVRFHSDSRRQRRIARDSPATAQFSTSTSSARDTQGVFFESPPPQELLQHRSSPRNGRNSRTWPVSSESQEDRSEDLDLDLLASLSRDAPLSDFPTAEYASLDDVAIRPDDYDHLSRADSWAVRDPLSDFPSPAITFNGDEQNSPANSLQPSDWALPRRYMSLSPYPNGAEFTQRDGSRYMQFYIEKVVRRFTPLWEGVDNPFIAVVIPVSFRSPILLHAIHAMAASEAALTSLDKRADTLRSLWHKHNAMMLFRQSIANAEALTATSLVSCVMLQSIEVMHSGVQNWHYWLQGAVLMIKTRNQLDQDLDEGNQWATFSKIVVAMEILAAVTADNAMSLAPKYWKCFLRCIDDDRGSSDSQESKIHERASQDDFFEKLVGCPTVVLLVLAEIAQHLETSDITVSTARSFSVTSEKFQRWEDLLYRWSPLDRQGPSAHLMESFRHSALVHYSRRVRKLPYTHSLVQHHVLETLNHIDCLDNKDYSVVTAWPLMIAGLELNRERYPQVADQLVSQVRGARTGGNKNSVFDEMEQLLDLVWSRRSQCLTWEQKVAVDWRDISAERGWKWCFW